MRGAVSKSGGNALLASVVRALEDRVSIVRWNLKGFEEKYRAVIYGSHPVDELVGQRWGKVEPALWRRRRIASPLAYQGVCGRHGTEDFRVTPGDLGAFVPVRGR